MVRVLNLEKKRKEVSVKEEKILPWHKSYGD